MRITVGVVAVGLMMTGFATGWTMGCGGASGFDGFGDGGADTATGPGSETCPACVTTSSCATGAVCAQFQGDTFCAPACGQGGTCPSGRTCAAVSSYNGDQVSVCVPNDAACGTGGGGSGGTGGAGGAGGAGGGGGMPCDAGNPGMCGTYAGPSVPAGCHSCSASSSSCQPNGCYGGWWCDTATNTCHASAPSCPPPPTCGGGGSGGSGGGGGTGGSGGGSSSITGSGGTMDALYFGVVGDTRPANEDDTSGYPTSIIQKIFQDLDSASPKVPFIVSTGDYEFASPSGSQSAAQLGIYMSARAMYSGVTFPAMGNHECTGATASNCGPSGTDGTTTNYNNFLSTMLAPIGQSKPYYSVNINATTGAWTSKFVFVAANAWDSAQSSWLSSTLAASTTYTFVIRHESSSANTAPGVSPSDAIIDRYPCTLKIVGHSHTYEWEDTNQVIIGNGGAPLSGSGNYGYGLIAQQSDGTITVDMVDYMSGTTDSSFHRHLTATGSSAP